jgi:hypothetical protein
VTEPIPKAEQKVALAELQELKTQLQELLDMGFMCPSVSLSSFVCEEEIWQMKHCINYCELTKMTMKN